MFRSDSNYLFEVMKRIHYDLFISEKIGATEEEFLNASVHKLHRLFRELIRVITILDTEEFIDFEYYMNLSYISNGELKKSEIEQDDPFYPIYEHSKNLLETLNYLKEFSNPEGIASLPKDLLVKLILFSKETFLSNVNISMCKRYNLKGINNPHERIRVTLVTKYQINKIYLEYINVQQEIFGFYLDTNQMQLPEFISESTAYDRLIRSYNEFCRDENLKEINRSFTTVNNDGKEVSYEVLDETEVDDKTNANNTFTDKLSHIFPNDLNSESHTLERFLPYKIKSYDPRNFMLTIRHAQAYRSHLNGISSNSVGLYGQLSFLIFILMLIGFYKKIF